MGTLGSKKISLNKLEGKVYISSGYHFIKLNKCSNPV